MTTFLIMNPDQSYPYKHDLKENQKQNSSNAFFPLAENQLKNLLTSRKLPSFLLRYEKECALHYQVLHYIFQNSLKFSPIDRWCIKKIENSLNECLEWLTVLQASALEESDRRIAENKCCISKYKSPLNNGTGSCAFLPIGIIDKCTKFSMFDVDKVRKWLK